MTELSFLIDLLMSDKLSKKQMRLKIADRIKEIEVVHASRPQGHVAVGLPAHMAHQAPSTLANLAKSATVAPIDPTIPPPIVATTPAIAMALENRQKAVAAAMSGKPETGRTSPRKF